MSGLTTAQSLSGPALVIVTDHFDVYLSAADIS